MKGLDAVPVVILCGGNGIYIDGSGKRYPKPLVDVAGKPMVHHVIDHYQSYGFCRFILNFGQGHELAQDYFKQAPISQGTEIVVVHGGDGASTGERVWSVRDYLEGAPSFCVAYSDVISDINLRAQMDLHRKLGCLATIAATFPETRFRILGLRHGDDLVRGFAAKPVVRNDYINGGYYIFESNVLHQDFMRHAVVLEEDVVEFLAKTNQLVAYRHEGYWDFLDCERDWRKLTDQMATEAKGRDI